MDEKDPKKQNAKNKKNPDNPQPGTSSQGSTNRLVSFLGPRNLLLESKTKLQRGGMAKAMPKPNLNVQRNKKTEDGAPIAVEPGSTKGKGRGRGRGRGQGNDRGRGRGKSNNLIQTVGIFSEGIHIDSRPNSSGGRYSSGGGGGGGGGSSKENIVKPKLKLDYVYDKEAEDKMLELLLKDDFIDDGDDDDEYMENAPIILPLIKESKEKHPVKKLKTEIKAEPGSDDEGRKAIEPMVVDEPEEEIDIKPTILENGVAVPPPELKPKSSNKFIPPVSDNKSQATVQQIINQSGFVMIRFPDCLPGFPDTNEKTAGPSSQAPKIKAITSSSNQPTNVSNDEAKLCTLKDLQPGHIGKLQILRSGKARLVLGENNLVVEVGSRVGFRQDVIAAKVNEDKKEIINLGAIDSTLICTPDFENMLNRLNIAK